MGLRASPSVHSTCSTLLPASTEQARVLPRLKGGSSKRRWNTSRGFTEEKSCAVFDVNENDAANLYLLRTTFKCLSPQALINRRVWCRVGPHRTTFRCPSSLFRCCPNLFVLQSFSLALTPHWKEVSEKFELPRSHDSPASRWYNTSGGSKTLRPLNAKALEFILIERSVSASNVCAGLSQLLFLQPLESLLDESGVSPLALRYSDLAARLQSIVTACVKLRKYRSFFS